MRKMKEDMDEQIRTILHTYRDFKVDEIELVPVRSRGCVMEDYMELDCVFYDSGKHRGMVGGFGLVGENGLLGRDARAEEIRSALKAYAEKILEKEKAKITVKKIVCSGFIYREEEFFLD